MEDTFLQIAAILLIATVAGAVSTQFRQPLIVAFIGVGILVGPIGLGWVEPGSGIVIARRSGHRCAVVPGRVSSSICISSRAPARWPLVTGLGQVGFTSIVGFGTGPLAWGSRHLPALYVAVALTFSSTIIIVKLLSDKRELDEPHGRIAVGFLIVQDIVVVLGHDRPRLRSWEPGQGLGYGGGVGRREGGRLSRGHRGGHPIHIPAPACRSSRLRRSYWSCPRPPGRSCWPRWATARLQP